MSNPTVDRNGITKELSEQVFGKKSPHAGKKFFAPVMTIEKFDEDSKWVGPDNIVRMTNKVLRTIFADILIDNTDKEKGTINEEQMAIDYADFTAGTSKLSDIEEQLDDLQALQQSYALDDDFGATDQNGVKTERAVELEKLIKETADKIKPLRVEKASIEQKYQERAAKRKDRKAATVTPQAEATVAAAA